MPHQASDSFWQSRRLNKLYSRLLSRLALSVPLF